MQICFPHPASDRNSVCLTFSKTADRWSHCWQLIQGDDWIEILASVEGTPADDFPACPPAQDLDDHALPNGDAILGVGMAGHGHWSMSYSIEANAEQKFIKADLACLLKKSDLALPWLGSTYQLGNHVNATTIANNVHLDIAGIKVCLQPGSADTQLTTTGQRLTITPTNCQSSQTVATRWLFECHAIT